MSGKRAQGRRSAAGDAKRRRMSARAMVLAALLLGLLVSAALPGRELVAQKRKTAELRAEEAALTDTVRALEARKGRLVTDAEVERIARGELGMVRPGETAFAIAPAPSQPRPDAVPTAAEEPETSRPWYKRFWDALTGKG